MEVLERSNLFHLGGKRDTFVNKINERQQIISIKLTSIRGKFRGRLLPRKLNPIQLFFVLIIYSTIYF